MFLSCFQRLFCVSLSVKVPPVWVTPETWRAWLGQAVVGLKLWEWRLRNWEIDRVIAWIPTIVEDARIQILISRVQAKLENRQNEIRDTGMQRLWLIELTLDSKLSQIKFYVRGNEIVSDAARLGRRQWLVYCVWEPRPRAAHHCLVPWFPRYHRHQDTVNTGHCHAHSQPAREHSTHQQINTSFVIMRSFLLARSIVAVLKVF